MILAQSTGRPFLASFVGAVLASLCAAQSPPLPADVGGEWGGVYWWQPVMNPAGGGHEHVEEIGHAALIPVGRHRGKVLLWNLQVQPPTTRTFLFDPTVDAAAGPQSMVQLPGLVSANIFCSGQTFLPDGSLLAAGGIPSGSLNGLRVHRFRPLNGDWVELAPMEEQRYYPTAMLLNRRPISTAGGAWQTPGSSVLVIGGPNQFTHQPIHGRREWETLGSIQDSWQTLVAPPFPGSSACLTATGHAYDVVSPLGDAPHGCDDVKFDSYPRALQLSSGDIFLAGDVDTDFDEGVSPGGLSPKGRTWFIRPAGVGDAVEWEAHAGPWMGGGPPEQGFNRRFYAPAVLLHQLTHQDRVLVFGGATEGPFAEDPSIALQANGSVQELVVTSTDISPSGGWQDKADLLEARAYANAVILPTGEILITGGQRRGPAPGAPTQAVHPCEIYAPGNQPTDPGSSRFVNLPTTPGGPIARLYHHIALLLPDGRVLVAGGDDLLHALSPYSGEIFKPPYLFQGARPVVEDMPTEVAFATTANVPTFTVSATIELDDEVDRVVLLRPASVTHHFDVDQRYIELEFTAIYSYAQPSSPPNPPPPVNKGATLTVKAPHESLGPQGWYMLFVVTQKANPAHRVPSEGQFIRFL